MRGSCELQLHTPSPWGHLVRPEEVCDPPVGVGVGVGCRQFDWLVVGEARDGSEHSTKHSPPFPPSPRRVILVQTSVVPWLTKPGSVAVAGVSAVLRLASGGLTAPPHLASEMRRQEQLFFGGAGRGLGTAGASCGGEADGGLAGSPRPRSRLLQLCSW